MLLIDSGVSPILLCDQMVIQKDLGGITRNVASLPEN